MKADWIDRAILPPDETAAAAAAARQDQLTKPRGALGRLEELAIRLAGLQGREKPSLDRVRIAVFAGDHGVAAEGVSVFPQSVTVEMVRNFSAGGAAISVLARHIGAELEVVDTGAVGEAGTLPGVVSDRVGAGTANFCEGPAMTPEQLEHALGAGRRAVERAAAGGTQLFIGGEMGIANTSAAAAVACGLLGLDAAALTGPGTGLDADGVSHKTRVIDRALALHAEAAGDPAEVMRRLGGFELGALAGAYIACAQAGIPALVDGFISSAAALTALRLRPDCAPWLMLSHAS
ncbi:MAG TPA: nicotinate-nucleotide--dimethylbenzimidazole phosphoribosyltransferase, partial [Gammaproteobacteria bacterium]|nr:nicotinate-nucleotide--dimethylbenzimidazole phosphoribosyltransferase [Gammaproteobacteria bacterium]